MGFLAMKIIIWLQFPKYCFIVVGIVKSFNFLTYLHENLDYPLQKVWFANQVQAKRRK